MDAQIKNRIDELVQNNKVFLFMKGSPEMPMCGFSARAAAMLKHHGAEYKSFNILDDEDIRQGVKEYSEWPTFPQLYVNGELVGGCDIMTEMHESGELGKVLGK